MIVKRMRFKVFWAAALFLAVGALWSTASGRLLKKPASSSLAIKADKPEAASFAGAVSGLIDHVIIHGPVVHENLAVFPLSWKGEADPAAYTTLKDSAREKKVEITEKGSGSVPRLKLTNKNKVPLFIMTGEVLTGAKQDRILASK